MALPAAGPTDCSSGFSQRIYNNFRYDYPWAAAATYAVGHLGCPTAPNGFGYKVTAITTGITAGAEPTWPLVLTNTVVDGGVTWTCQDVANPSGKGAGLVSLMSAGQLGNLQALAYAMAKAVADEIAADNPAWTAASFQNSWANNSGAGQQNAAYMLDSQGFYRLRGIVKSPGTAANSVVFALPAGPTKLMVMARVYLPNAGGTGTFRLDINTSGQVVCQTAMLAGDAFDLECLAFDPR